jgi:vacuolar-type H+-ATPase subunit E/Vma4
MKTLAEEREAIVEELSNWVTRGYEEIAKNDIRQALISHEEKVVARVREEIARELEKYQHESDMNSIGIQHLIKKLLTLPITDEKV